MTTAPGGGERVIAFVDDLMDRSKISAALPSAVFVRSVPADLLGERGAAHEGDVDGGVVAIVDGGRPRGIAMIGDLLAARARVVVFVPHVDQESAAEARRLGAVVCARSRFFRDVRAALAPGPHDGAHANGDTNGDTDR